MLSAERLPVGEELIGENAQREDIGPAIERLTADLLGSQVRGGPERDAGLRQVRLVSADGQRASCTDGDSPRIV